MKVLAISVAALLSACGGGDDPEDTREALRASAMASAEEGCTTHGRQCADGSVFWTP